MPNFDGTGPQGKGSRTGRGVGKCPEANTRGANRPGRGQGQSLGLGRGRGPANTNQNSENK
ncbi:MAG: DUF5320 domain-containing protein [Candidatus Uhrbacteria bacterium]|nr:DUF5320 domain-containing protein [Patescibacteria group bacterium]MBU1907009.1 DUF5320 domain-containing protein [Patescibacteria group bacterium]